MGKNNKDLIRVFKKFLQLEEEFDLFNKEINNVYFWERIRFNIHRQIEEVVGLNY
jgi:hypothetical protein